MKMLIRCMLSVAAISAWAQSQPPAAPETAPSPEPAAPVQYRIETGTKIPLNLMNSVSTRTAAEGDRVYLETIFPILNGGRIVIPPGSYVAGTVTQVRRPGKVKGRAELFIRFDALTLPNGVTRDFRARVGTLDGANSETVDRAEGKIKGDSNKGSDALVVAQGGMWGTAIGGIAGRSATGAGIGAAAGAAAGMIGVLMSRGPDALLERGSTLEMVLDRDLSFTADEIDFSGAPPSRRNLTEGGEQKTQKRTVLGSQLPGRRN